MNFIALLLFIFPFIRASYPIIDSCEDAVYSGAYTLKTGDYQVDLQCDADTDGGGWHTILTRRGGYQNFYQNWRTYADDGIGSPKTEYFLPLNFLHYFTSEDTFELLIEIKEKNQYLWALYRRLQIASEQENFKLTIGDFEKESTAGNSIFHHNELEFSTFDRDNDSYDKNCSAEMKAAGWFSNCGHVNLFGQYENSQPWRGIFFYPKFEDPTVSMDFLSLKLRKPKCVNGFGSSCVSCLPDYYLPIYPLYPRLTCLHQCTVSNCKICYAKIYPYCNQCNQGYQVNKKGECEKEIIEPQTPCECEDEAEQEDNTPALANCNIYFYNYDSKIQNIYIKSNDTNVHFKPDP